MTAAARRPDPPAPPELPPSQAHTSTSTRSASTGTGVTGNDSRLQAVHQRLLEAVGALTTEQGWQHLLRTAAALPTYSPHNVLLIAQQRPTARAVAGFHTWKSLGRPVRKGQRGIAILAPVLRRGAATAQPSPEHTPGAAHPDTDRACGAVPKRLAGFRVVHVFDISQTDGPTLPDPTPLLLDGPAPPGLLDGLSAQVRTQGFRLLRHDVDIAHPGQRLPNGVTDYLTRTVIIRPDLAPAQSAKTLAHELGHVLLHGPGRGPADLTREQAEVEAESVAFVVTAAHGLDSSGYTIPYVAGWSAGDTALVARTAERVLTTAKDILSRTPPPPTLHLDQATRERLRSREPAPPPAERAGASPAGTPGVPRSRPGAHTPPAASPRPVTVERQPADQGRLR